MANNILLESGSKTLLESGSALQLESGTADVAFIDLRSRRPRVVTRAALRTRRARETIVVSSHLGPVASRLSTARIPRRMLRARARRVEVFSPPAAPVVPSARARQRTRVWPRRRRPVEIIPAQVVVANPAFVPGRVQRRRPLGLLRRGHSVFPLRPSSAPGTPCSLLLADGASYLLLANGVDHLSLALCIQGFIDMLRRRRRVLPPRLRRRTIEVVPAQVVQTAPVLVFARAQRRATRGWPRRSKPINVIPATAAPINPPIVLSRTQRRVQRGWLRSRGRGAQTVPAQVVQINPALPGNTTLRRRVRAWFVRRRQHRAPLGGTGASILDAPTPTNVSGPDGRGDISGLRGTSTVDGPDGRSAVTGPPGSTIIQ